MDTQQAKDIINGMIVKNNQENEALQLAIDVLDAKLVTESLAVNAKQEEIETLKTEKDNLISEKEALEIENEELKKEPK